MLYNRIMKAERDVVGRAELKLAGAVAAFGYDFRGKVVLDIGSSTGGFTELALRKGAVKVIAIEKGTRQMKAPLRFDPRIELHEKTDFLELDSFSSAISASNTATAPSPYREYGSVRCSRFPRTSSRTTSSSNQLPTSSKIISPSNQPPINLLQSNKAQNDDQKQGRNVAELVTALQVGVDLRGVETVLADVSFVSLRKILVQARKLVPRTADYLVMLKPQFEARPEQLVKGVVKNERMRREIVRDFEQWLVRQGFVIVKKRDNDVIGKVGGNQERFYWLRIAPGKAKVKSAQAQSKQNKAQAGSVKA